MNVAGVQVEGCAVQLFGLLVLFLLLVQTGQIVQRMNVARTDGPLIQRHSTAVLAALFQENRQIIEGTDMPAVGFLLQQRFGVQAASGPPANRLRHIPSRAPVAIASDSPRLNHSPHPGRIPAPGLGQVARCCAS